MMIKIFRKQFCSKVIKDDKKIKNFYTFMEENMSKVERTIQNKQTNHSEKEILESIIKCPMTDSNLEVTSDGLKVGHILFPKRNGIYILIEEKAQFKF